MTDRATHPDISPARKLFEELALAVEGLGARDTDEQPDRRDRYIDLICFNEGAGIRWQMALMSGCALTVRGLWRRAGLHHPRLVEPYVVGHAVADVVAIAREASAWRNGHGDPDVGDVVVIDHPEHVFTVVGRTPDGLDTIEGGQRDATSAQCILRKFRTPEVYKTRPMLGWVDCEALAAHYALGR